MTKKTVSNWAKKNFLIWFADSFQFQSENAHEFLLYIARRDDLLSRMHLLLEGPYPEPLIIIAIQNTGMPPLMIKDQEYYSNDPETIVEYLKSLGELPFYLTLYFPERSTCEIYRAVAEENRLVNDLIDSKEHLIDFELSLWNESFKSETLRQELMREIDQALEKRDKRRFKKLVKKLKEL